LKKTLLALTLVFTFLLSYIVVDLATANPAPLFAFPTKPLTTPPTILVHSPVENQAYNTTGVWLNFTIVKPEEWFAIDVASHADYSPLTETFVNITSVYAVIDGVERQNMSVHDIDSLFDTSPTLSLNFSTLLPLAAGEHTVKVSVEAVSYYVVNFVDWSNPFSNVTLHADSETMHFTVYQPFPIVPAVAVSIVAVVMVAGLLIYHQRHKAKLSNRGTLAKVS
jgi:hypothetical protein